MIQNTLMQVMTKKENMIQNTLMTAMTKKENMIQNTLMTISYDKEREYDSKYSDEKHEYKYRD